VVSPKVDKVRKVFKDLLKEPPSTP